jgi:hypothetical protein
MAAVVGVRQTRCIYRYWDAPSLLITMHKHRHAATSIIEHRALTEGRLRAELWKGMALLNRGEGKKLNINDVIKRTRALYGTK